MTIKTSALFMACLLLFSSCAANLKSLNPNLLDYESGSTNVDLPVSYEYDLLAKTNNRKYNRKANEADIKLVSIRITNNTDSSLTINDDVQLYHGNTPVIPMSPELMKAQMKQKVPGYLFHLLFISLSLVTEDGESIPLGWVLGPTLAIVNVGLALNSNAKLIDELNEYSLMDKVIPPKTTVYGILGLSNMGYSPISAKIVNK